MKHPHLKEMFPTGDHGLSLTIETPQGTHLIITVSQDGSEVYHAYEECEMNAGTAPSDHTGNV